MSWAYDSVETSIALPKYVGLQNQRLKLLQRETGEKQRKLVIDVRDYGTRGDGLTDDSVAFKAAIADASADGGGVVSMPIGTFPTTSQLIIPPYVSLKGQGRNSRINYSGAGFGIQVGNNASGISYGTTLSDFIMVLAAGSHGITPYGAADCVLQNLYIEGVAGGTNIAVQIDGADIGCFFVLMQNVHCSHVLKGFVHTTTGTTQCTQVLGINCFAYCDNTTGSIGIDIQNVAGVGMGDGVTYMGGNMEACKIGVNLNGAGTSIVGMRFENMPQDIAQVQDIVFDTLASNNQIIGGYGIYSILDNAGVSTNQVIAAGRTNPLSQINKLDNLSHAGTTAGFFGTTAIVQPTGTPAAATDLASVIALANSLRTSHLALGLIG